MPELPEVETIKKQLNQQLPLTFQAVKSTAGFKKNILKTSLVQLKGKTLTHIHRKGKILDFVFNDDSHLISHLGMTGTWLLASDAKLTKHSHLILKGLNSKNEKMTLAYDDPRRFGKMYFLAAEEAARKLNSLGLDLIDPSLDLEYLKNVLKKFPDKPLKVALLDQKYFAGSGNYIANEICARAGIRPDRKIKKIKEDEYPCLHQAIAQVILPALTSGGTTFQGGYRDSTGGKGMGKSHLVVFYQKTCQLCGVTPVTKIILAQRGTYYCKNCQK